jgi:hypothetical protein
MNKVLAALDDTRAGALLLDCSAALARRRQLALEVVYVESSAALAAASWRHAQVLAHAGAIWTGFAPPDVERGFRAQAARLQTMVREIAQPLDVAWSLRSMRSTLADAALELLPQAAILLRAPTAVPAAMPRGLRRIAVAQTGTDPALDRRCCEAADDLARALARGRPVVLSVVTASELASHAIDCDLLVLPHALARQPLLAASRVPSMWVA